MSTSKNGNGENKVPSKAGKIWGIILVLIASVAVIGSSGCDSGGGGGKKSGRNVMSREKAASKLEGLMREVSWSEQLVKRRAKIQLGRKSDLAQTLPDIREFPLTVNPDRAANTVVVEIFVTTVRAWSPLVPGRTRTADGRMVEVARDFNAKNFRLKSGKIAKVQVRYIASGTAYQFIASKKYLPDAYSPVHSLWIRMATASGIKMTRIRDKMVSAVGGVVMKTPVAEKIKATYGNLDVKSIINEVVQGNLAMGYTDPFHSSTGLNFLQTILSTFADGKEQDMLSPSVISTFEKFQNGVPFVAQTTIQRRDAVMKSGSLEAFVMGYQTFLGADVLQSGFEFIPFGVRHDHPLYAVGDPGRDKMETLELLAKFAERPENLRLAKKYGWNQPLVDQYKPTVSAPSGETLIRAQKLWKEKKDAGRPIAAVFLADVSGSMSGHRIQGVRAALIAGSEFIGPENSIGMVVFENDVRVVLQIKKFNLNQKAAFHAAVQDTMDTGGGTAMYNGITVALTMLIEEKKKNPNVKPILFVLTDGKTNEGLGFSEMSAIIEGLKIPIYTIGYEAKIDELKRLSSLVEAASFNAKGGNVQNKIGALLNAQM